MRAIRLCAAGPLGGLDAPHVRERLFQAGDTLAARTLARRTLPSGDGLIMRIAHCLDPAASRRQVPLDLRFALERAAARIGGDLGAVVGHGPELDQPLGAQHAKQLREELVECGPVSHPEARQGVVAHQRQAGQPAEGRIVLAS